MAVKLGVMKETKKLLMGVNDSEAPVKTELIQIELDQIRHIATGGYSVGVFMEFNGPVSTYIGYSEKWVSLYSSRGYAMSDPTIHWAQYNDGIIRWSDVDGYADSEIACEAAKNGLISGATASATMNGRKSIATFAKKDNEFIDIELNVLLGALRKLHLAHTPTAVLTSLEFDVLKYVVQGKTNKEISLILGVSNQTVKVRLSSMKEKLGVSSTPELVYIASKLKLI